MDNRQNLTNINWYPGHMAKTRREIKENLNLIDVVLEVVDARMPISSKIVDLDDLVGNKPRILVVTKYDLCDSSVTDEILTRYKKEGTRVVSIDLMHGESVQKIIQEILSVANDLNDRRRAKGMKPRRIRALVVGVPNVGKSTLINRLVGKKAVIVGNRPGVTKSLGWIRIHDSIELLDSPGILWPKIENQEHTLNLAALSSIREEILPLDEVALHILKMLSKYYPQKLGDRYGVIDFSQDDIDTILETIAKKRGALLKGGAFDYEKVYLYIIRDVRDGLIKGITFDR